MPAIVSVVLRAIVVNLVRFGLSKGVAILIGKFVIGLAINAAIGAAMRALQPKPRAMDQGAELRSKLDPAYPREVGVGTFATGGSLVYENVSGANNKYLWRVFAISDAKISQITKVRGNGLDLTFSGDIHTGLRACTSHFQSATGADCLEVRIYKGTSTQVVDPDLDAAFAEIDSNFRGRGVAYALLRMTYDNDAWNAGGDFVFVGEGASCYDPRTGLSAYSENAALIAGQFLRGFENNGVRVVGLGCADADVPDADIEYAADICDENVALAGGGTEDRYRAGGMISARESAREVLTHLCAAMNARHIDRGGEIVLLPGAARASVLPFTITLGDVLSDAPIQYAGRRTADQRVNAITSTFVNPADGYQEGSLPPRKDTAAITEDGERFETSRAYRYVQSKTQGQRLDEMELRAARKEGRLSLSLPLWAIELQPGDCQFFDLPHWGGGLKLFEVETIGIAISGGANPSARCVLSLFETAPSVYDWTTADEITQAAAAMTVPAALLSRFDNLDRLSGTVAAGNSMLTGVSAHRASNPLTAADVGSTATVSIAAFSYKVSEAGAASLTVSYNSGSVAGLSFSTLYHIWAYDPTLAGGAVTYAASTSTTTYIGDNNYVYVGSITTPANGAGPTGGGFDCVAAEAWLAPDQLARNARVGDLIDVLSADGQSIERAAIEGVRVGLGYAVRLISGSGARLCCAVSTPITQPDGSVVFAPEALGAAIAVVDGVGLRWERVMAVEPAGLIEVAHIHVGGRTYAAGDAPGARLFTHNAVKP